MNDATTKMSDPTASYRVLARKYRPSTFADLIGQDAMVRTISNAFESGRIPQAWILTGVRGVGKTTTARILARALNYELPDGSITGPTIDMPVLGVHCQAIMESRHLDVIEMDAASHNSVEDVRAINDAIRYAPVSARYKVYILDEVHMLSGAAFNALLKTLEEPPPHAKFVFATTEIRKVPITVLSRCQRFDLRRVDAALLVKHLQGIAGKEAITAEPEALAMIARAAEGSVRDALSLFDQAIAHAGGAGAHVSPAGARRRREADARPCRPRQDHRSVRGADARRPGPRVGRNCATQYDAGADPAMVLGDLAEFTHFVTRVKIVPAFADDVSLTETERTRGRAFAAKLSMRVLARTWQMLLKGIEEVAAAGRPLAAAEMVLVRIAYAADLPTPDEVIRSLGDSVARQRRLANAERAGCRRRRKCQRARRPRARTLPRGGTAGRAARQRRPNCRQTSRSRAVKSTASLRANSRASRNWWRLPPKSATSAIKSALERDVRLVRFEDGQARNRTRSQRAESADRRTVEEARRLDRPALDGDRLGRTGPAEPLRAGPNAQGRAEGRRARRPAGAGGARAVSRRRDRGRAAARRHARRLAVRTAGRSARHGRRTIKQVNAWPIFWA